MKRNIVISKSRGTPIEKHKVEIVERKGLGHPDYIADSLAESFSKKLSRYYIDNFGRILHHNVDKLEVIGGVTEPEFGGGKVIKPISILFSGRATNSVNGKDIPTEKLALSSTKEWLKNNIRFIDPESLRYIFETKNGSANLSTAFNAKGKIGSNDTSFGVGYAPFSESEKLVWDLERMANSKEFKRRFPFSGEDVKVMCVRKGDKMDVTVAMAFIDKYVSSVSDYFNKKEEILSELNKNFSLTKSGRKVKIQLNGMDNKKSGKDGCYLTVTGSSSEHGDDGAVGRGNRVNGLITPNRPMSLEATAGKNPVNHVGKIYNLFCFKLADKLYENFKLPVYTKIVGRIGTPIDEPIVASVDIFDKVSTDQKKQMSAMVDEELSKINDITKDILDDKLGVC